MERIYKTYKDIADVYIVYISEAHAVDDRRPVGIAREKGIKEHTTYGERCAVAESLVKDKKLTIPCLIDGIDDAVDKDYNGHPDRVFLVGKDGKLAIAGKRGPWGFKPALEEAEAWLAEYKKTGKEPALKKAEKKDDKKDDAKPEKRAESGGEEKPPKSSGGG